MIKKIALLLVFLAPGFYTLSAQQNITSLLNSIVYNTVKGKTTYKQEDCLYQDSIHYKEILWRLQDFYNHPKSEVRDKAYQITRNIGVKSTDKVIKQKVVSNLVNALKDKNYGLVRLVIQYLGYFDFAAFNSASRTELLRFTREEVAHYADFIRLIGIINFKEAIPIIKEKLSDTKTDRSLAGWAMHLALARMGDEGEIFLVMKEVKSMPLTDKVVNNVYPDLVYMDKRDGYDYLMDVILNDSKNCNSPQPDNENRIVCAFKVIQIIGNHVDGFPVQIDEFGEIETSNYDELLLNVREWIRTEWKSR